MAKKRNDRSYSTDPDALAGLGAQVRSRRKSLRLTQNDVADLAGCSVRFVNQLERGKGTVRLDKLVAVLEALGLELKAVPRNVS